MSAVKGASAWVEKLSQIEMPILSAVVHQLSKLTGSDDTEINQLAEVILKDPHLTTQILKIANSVQYNPANSPVNTVSRAIVMLGFRGVRSLCISLMVIDSLLKHDARDRLLSTMAKAFHAAVQARAIYAKLDENNLEEVFIGALLHNLGEMAFWAYGGQTADALADATYDDKNIEKALGTSFKQLSRELGKIWNLGDALQEALSDEPKVSKRAQAVRLGEALSQLNPEDPAAHKALLQKVAAFTGGSLAQTRKLVNGVSDEAGKVALDYGAKKVCHLIPSQQVIAENKQAQSKKVQVLEADPHLQLKVLRDLANSVAEDVDINTVFQMALEGMHRGIGLERVVLAFFRGAHIQAKYVLGEATEGWREKFVFAIAEGNKNIFTESLRRPQAAWFDEAFLKRHQALYTKDVRELIGRYPAFIGVLRINGRNAALFYADRGSTGEALQHQQYESFKHFLSQAELSIQAMADKKR
ncbi:MAG: HDOD domain-containing protein [Cellvibrionaceae bacterium]|nr:HDOD domain-containing protein [Cellvibrionaceae bacterium]